MPVNTTGTSEPKFSKRQPCVVTSTPDVKELTASRDKLCGGASDCEALTALTTWASKEPPFTL